MPVPRDSQDHASSDSMIELSPPPLIEHRGDAIQGSGWSSSPGEFHSEALTDPYVTLSRHPALRSLGLLSCESKPSLETEAPPGCPVGPRLPSRYVILFAPRPLQTLHRYYRMIRHLQVHRYFPFVVRTYRFSLSITCRLPMFRITASWQAQATSHAGCRSARKQVPSELFPQ